MITIEPDDAAQRPPLSPRALFRLILVVVTGATVALYGFGVIDAYAGSWTDSCGPHGAVGGLWVVVGLTVGVLASLSLAWVTWRQAGVGRLGKRVGLWFYGSVVLVWCAIFLSGLVLLVRVVGGPACGALL